ncbi:hypothetical protein N7519_008033 [Penicillium mononematosum]|uniref:uncharacterized protein n=1 Tax=Penicillium mononematosum TaxID=268346 RepID=UPI0025480EB0|nr:uncharacterized protein N7519_008033 [Penicillium mononematosum]KAJ6186732.1 hypothetical protein N7519_008033 [Penicillium mononematosum]
MPQLRLIGFCALCDRGSSNLIWLPPQDGYQQGYPPQGQYGPPPGQGGYYPPQPQMQPQPQPQPEKKDRGCLMGW